MGQAPLPGASWAVVLRTCSPVRNVGCSDEALGLQMQNQQLPKCARVGFLSFQSRDEVPVFGAALRTASFRRSATGGLSKESSGAHARWSPLPLARSLSLRVTAGGRRRWPCTEALGCFPALSSKPQLPRGVGLLGVLLIRRGEGTREGWWPAGAGAREQRGGLGAAWWPGGRRGGPGVPRALCWMTGPAAPPPFKPVATLLSCLQTPVSSLGPLPWPGPCLAVPVWGSEGRQDLHPAGPLPGTAQGTPNFVFGPRPCLAPGAPPVPWLPSWSLGRR